MVVALVALPIWQVDGRIDGDPMPVGQLTGEGGHQLPALCGRQFVWQGQLEFTCHGAVLPGLR